MPPKTSKLRNLTVASAFVFAANATAIPVSKAYAADNCVDGAIETTKKVALGALLFVGADCFFFACTITAAAVTSGGGPLALALKGTLGAATYGCADALLDNSGGASSTQPQSPAATAPRSPPPALPNPEQVQKPNEAPTSITASLAPTTPPLDDQERAYIRELKSALVIRGRQITKQSRKRGIDGGIPYRETVSFMDSVANDQWDLANRDKLKVRLELLAARDKLVGDEVKRITRKAAAAYGAKAGNLTVERQNFDPNKALEIMSRPMAERPNAPSRPVLDTSHEMG